MSNDESLKKFGLLCQQVTAEPSLTIKEELIRGFIGRYNGDLGLLLKLLLPKNANRIYYTQEKQLLRVLSTVLSVPEDTLKTEWNRNGCIAESAQKYFKVTAPVDRDGWCAMTLSHFDNFLDQMAAASNEILRVNVVRAFLQEACTHAVYFFFRELKLDLRLGAGLRIVLKGLHPSAYEIFQHCADIQEVVRRVKAGANSQSLPDSNNNGLDGLDDGNEEEGEAAPVAAVAKPTPKAAAARAAAGGVRKGAVAAQIRLGMPLAPMLAAPAKSVDQVLAKCPNGAFSEVKYDGERIQIHKQGNSLTFFARSLKPMQPDKFAGLEPFLRQAIKANECILDGEILMVDIRTSIPLPFGTLGKHKRTQFTTACPCVFLFDILYKDGEPLLLMPLEERRDELKKAVEFTRNRVMFSELCLVMGDLAQRKAILQQHLNRAIAEGLEGLVIKDVKSVYEPRARHWIKLKKDYLDGLADSADLLVLGAWYGSGNKGGQLSTFLMGCVDTGVPAGQPLRYRTVCKVGNGLDDTATAVLSQKYTSRMAPPAHRAAPVWLDCHSSHLPDMIVQDPTRTDVMEIIGAEFSVTKTHTAGISVRFPRILRIRTDKDATSATTLQELMALFRTSKEKLTTAGVPDSLQLVDSYVIAPGGGGDDTSNLTPPPAPQPQTAAPAAVNEESEASQGQPPAAPAYTLAPGLTYVKGGGATKPAVPDTENVVLCHSSAVGGVWSQRGFMGQVTRTYGDNAEVAYAQSVGKRSLGDVIVTEVQGGPRTGGGKVFVATMMGQTTAPRGQVPQVDQPSLMRCLAKCTGFARQNNASLHVVQPPEETHADWAAVDAALRAEAFAGAAAQAGGVGLKVVVYGSEPPHTKAATPPPQAAAKRTRSPERPVAATDEALKAAVPVSSAGTATPALPRTWWSLLQDVRAQVLTGDAPAQDVCEALEMLGARVVHVGRTLDAVVACTHVVMGTGAAVNAAPPPGVAVVTRQWVDDCLGLRTRHAEELYRPVHLQVLAGCRLLLSAALHNRPEWQRLAALLGARVHTAWKLIGDRSTHCVSDAWDEEAEKVFQLGGRVVSPRWLVDSAVAQSPLPARAYLLPRLTAKSSGPGVGANPLEGVLCGLKVCVQLQPTTLAASVVAAVQQMGGEVVDDANTAQYCVLAQEDFVQEADAMSLAVRFRCVSPAWLWASARKKSLQDPAAYLLSKTTEKTNTKAKGTGVEEEEEEKADDKDDGRSVSSYSTDTYVEDEQELQANGTADEPGDVLTEEDEDAEGATVPEEKRARA